MIYYFIAFIFGFSIGFVSGIIANGARHRYAGRLKITNDEDGTYCFLVFKRHPNEFKDGDTIELLVDVSDITHK